jgi:CDP-6-deoxy-D-xylo-4-hexulose-3-dehydrase
VYTDNDLLDKIARSLSNWGRDCWCIGGVDNTCGCRFTGKFGELPIGYDHKYVYSHLGFNLKVTDLQASIGCAQLQKIDHVVASRRKNYKTLYEGLKGTPYLILPEPEANSNPSWFGFPISVEEGAPFTRNEISNYLESKKVQTRTLFAGNIIKHPAFDEMRRTGEGYRVVGDLKWTDYAMNNTFWIGVFPGLKTEEVQYMIQTIKNFVELTNVKRGGVKWSLVTSNYIFAA